MELVKQDENSFTYTDGNTVIVFRNDYYKNKTPDELKVLKKKLLDDVAAIYINDFMNRKIVRKEWLNESIRS